MSAKTRTLLPLEKWAEYPRLLEKGVPPERMAVRAADLERFWSKVEKTENCWFWRASGNGKGYGFFSILGIRILTHRFSAYLVGLHSPKPTEVCHTCDVHSCVNPDHLFVGTKSDNMRDASRKRRLAVQKNPMSVNHLSVSPEKAVEIRKDKALTGDNSFIIAERLGVTPCQVRYICTKVRGVDKHYASITEAANPK